MWRGGCRLGCGSRRVVDGAGGEDGGVGAEVDGGGAYGGEECGGELAGVEAVLVEEDEAVVAGGECGEETSEVFGGESCWRGADGGWKGLQGGVGLEGDADAGESVEAVEEGGVEREAEVGERVELRRVVGIVGGEHSGGGGGGFGEWSGAVEDGDADAAVVEFEGEGEADDAGSGDADVGVVHGISLVGVRRGYSLVYRVVRRADERSGEGGSDCCKMMRLTIDRNEENGMSDEEYVEQRSIGGALLGVVAVALLAALGGLVWSLRSAESSCCGGEEDCRGGPEERRADAAAGGDQCAAAGDERDAGAECGHDPEAD